MKTKMVGLIIKIPEHVISKTKIEKLIKERVKKPLEWKFGVSHCACNQCGTVKEIDRIHSQKLLALSRKAPTLIDEIKRYYFTVSFCEYCKEKPVKVSLVERSSKKHSNG